MRTLPATMIRALVPFAPLFSKSVFQHVQVLVAGAILVPGRRTVSSALRAMGLDQEKRFLRYHRVLSRASWSSREVSRVLLGLLVEAFVPEGDPLFVGIDETLETYPANIVLQGCLCHRRDVEQCGKGNIKSCQYNQTITGRALHAEGGCNIECFGPRTPKEAE
jgi:hypothetical protein